MPTNFTSLRVKGAAYVGGALTIVGAAAFAAITATTGDFTGAVEALSFSGSTLKTSSGAVLNGPLTVNQTNNIWSVVAGANTACNTTCTSACVFGVNTAATEADIVDCASATADECLCAGGS